MQETSNEPYFNEDDYEEIWKVVMNTKGEYELSKNQAHIVREALARGERGVIVFETFTISLPYVAEFYRVNRFLKKSRVLPESFAEKNLNEMTDEERKRASEKIRRLKDKFKNPYSNK